MNTYDLNGRCAIITGAASGLGQAAAKRMVESGARVALWDVQDEALAAVEAELSPLGEVQSFKVDVADYASVEAAAKASEAALGAADILVNNAGINRPMVPLADSPLQDWDDIIAIDLTGVFYCCRAVMPAMAAKGYGRVINVASVAGKEGNAQAPAYSAAKAGVIALTKTFGKEFAEAGVIVNCITPTVIDTPLNRRSSAARPDMMQKLLEKIPLKRRGTVEEFASMCAWLASEECSYSTGAVFDLSGGRTTY